MSNLTKSFRDSFHELKDVKALATTAMLLAIAVVLGFYTLQVTDFIKIGFAFIADEMTGMMFGPVVGGLMGAAADIVKYLVRPTGAFFPGFTISGALSGVIYGVILYKKPLSIKRIALANGLDNDLCKYLPEYILADIIIRSGIYGNSSGARD